jgi:hypothetical protein
MNTPQKARELIELYCKHYGIKTNNLKRNNRYYPAKVIVKKDAHVNTSTMRMALAYFIFMHFPLRIKEVAEIVGYNDHSPISSQRKVVESYIKNNDVFFMPYYESLINLARELNISMEYKRMYTNVTPFMRYESDTNFAENIKYYENAKTIC